MIVFPNAKINVGLFVVDKRSDGYHAIDSVFYPVQVNDILEILPATDFSFSSSGLEINNRNNLVIDAFRLMQEKYAINNVFIHLHKQIPLGSGLGGGSSDAAHCLLALNNLFDLQIATSELHQLALTLGSDCPFFISSQPAHVTGRGEVLESTSLDLSGKYVYLINPGIHINTAEAFFGVKPNARKLSTELSEMTNDFETTVFRGHPILSDIKGALLQSGAIYASMTGTGSTIYGIFDKPPVKLNRYHFERVVQLE